MQIAQALRQTTKPFVSLEFFPPAAESHLPEFYETVERLRSIDPLFLSVTYGAGGGKQQNTLNVKAELARREAALAAREAQLEQEQAKLEAARAEAPKGRKTFLNNNDPDFVNPKEKLYDKFPLTVHQMDIIIGVLFALIALFLILGVTHTSFFGLFGG